MSFTVFASLRIVYNFLFFMGENVVITPILLPVTRFPSSLPNMSLKCMANLAVAIKMQSLNPCTRLGEEVHSPVLQLTRSKLPLGYDIPVHLLLSCFHFGQGLKYSFLAGFFSTKVIYTGNRVIVFSLFVLILKENQRSITRLKPGALMNDDKLKKYFQNRL